jgi:signal peptidase I
MSEVLEQTAPEAAAERPREIRHKTGWLASMQSLAITVVIAVFVITFLVQAFQIPSESMQNTLLIGDYLLVDKVHYGQGGIWGELLPYQQIRRGDIIVFRYPVHPQQHFVKRVIGVPGDHVRLVHKKVFVNGLSPAEDYVIHSRPDRDSYRDEFPDLQAAAYGVEERWWEQMRRLVRDGELDVPPDSYFVLGDNRDESLDSRYWGFVPRQNIIGRPLLIYWSVGSPRGESDSLRGRGDKLSSFLYAVTHLVQNTRWNRTLRIVH